MEIIDCLPAPWIIEDIHYSVIISADLNKGDDDVVVVHQLSLFLGRSLGD
jgi:hypothetical protein